uniref:Uncharacterized protein n=1 Tax=Bartonella rochalimae ATCC BAA-1498 TaxID=685782 RepID=E6YKL0_9HYPH|nr:hypothetical protein BARRO_20055 [Bartonella rochalimae ATCC BAA-1498]
MNYLLSYHINFTDFNFLSPPLLRHKHKNNLQKNLFIYADCILLNQ